MLVVVRALSVRTMLAAAAVAPGGFLAAAVLSASTL
jgi:hypothetical protein